MWAEAEKLLNSPFGVIHCTSSCHTVAAAQGMGQDCLQKTLQWRRKLKREVSLIPLLVQDKTKETAGKKSGAPNIRSGNYRGGTVDERREKINSPKQWMSSTHTFEAVELRKTRVQLCAGVRNLSSTSSLPMALSVVIPKRISSRDQTNRR